MERSEHLRIAARALRARRLALGLCTLCGQPLGGSDRTICDECRKHKAESTGVVWCKCGGKHSPKEHHELGYCDWVGQKGNPWPTCPHAGRYPVEVPWRKPGLRFCAEHISFIEHLVRATQEAA